ncbi:DUF5821 family protein [Halobaculum sp. MBLA0143]|uniref:transcriptional regulator TbsP domain-containing protein n=1 Tax=Halobaculum sp. MBLA0143 TaxID=3079933 RepID=UPI00352323D5
MSRDERPRGHGRTTDGRDGVLCVSPPAEFARSLLGRLHETRIDRSTPTVGGDVDVTEYVAAVPSVADGSTPIRLLVSEPSALLGRFVTAAVASDLRADDHLAVAAADDLSQRVTVADGAVHAHLRPTGELQSVTARTPSLCRRLHERYDRRWAAAEPLEPSTPGWRELTNTFVEAFPDAGETLRIVLADAPELPVSGTFDVVTVVGLVAARHGLQTMAVSEWAESIGLSSRTELSRVKSRLVDRGLVETDRVPQGVGRPRQKLLVDADRLRDCPPEDLLTHARALYDGATETVVDGD